MARHNFLYDIYVHERFWESIITLLLYINSMSNRELIMPKTLFMTNLAITPSG